MFSFIQLQADTLATAASNVVVEKVATTNEISVLGFILKGGFFFNPYCNLTVLHFLSHHRTLFVHQ